MPRCFWRPAANAAQAHREFLTYALGDGGGRGFASRTHLLIAAAPTRGGWVIGDAAMPEGDWAVTTPGFTTSSRDLDGSSGSNSSCCTTPAARLPLLCTQDGDLGDLTRAVGQASLRQAHPDRL